MLLYLFIWYSSFGGNSCTSSLSDSITHLLPFTFEKDFISAKIRFALRLPASPVEKYPRLLQRSLSFRPAIVSRSIPPLALFHLKSWRIFFRRHVAYLLTSSFRICIVHMISMRFVIYMRSP